ncbi:hypothetical protein D0469_15205 [Peribacillus saganii]|uniref:Uncharacterized protein n=1 Tax=Peribacillus saganii TaxID=2303992 RepID=A0A372LKH6_9BACI|nr:hypothetical protein [Peribacillus saganii]RFU67247.1 hypothetical protein D0469_15205 [Peribacillus saganii]
MTHLTPQTSRFSGRPSADDDRVQRLFENLIAFAGELCQEFAFAFFLGAGGVRDVPKTKSMVHLPGLPVFML